jgi:hypothetical protein
MTQYFRFEIPMHPQTGERIRYSNGWHGTIRGCPKNVKVMMYNDKEGYGIAYCEDDKPLAVGLTAITKVEHDKIIAEAVTEEPVYDEIGKITKEGVYVGEAIDARAYWKPEPIKVEEPVIEEVV